MKQLLAIALLVLGCNNKPKEIVVAPKETPVAKGDTTGDYWKYRYYLYYNKGKLDTGDRRDIGVKVVLRKDGYHTDDNAIVENHRIGNESDRLWDSVMKSRTKHR